MTLYARTLLEDITTFKGVLIMRSTTKYYIHRESYKLQTAVGKLKLRKQYYRFLNQPSIPVIGWVDEANVVQFWSIDMYAMVNNCICANGNIPTNLRPIHEFEALTTREVR